VTNLEGVDVFIPGYLVARTDASGRFWFPSLPVATYSLVARHATMLMRGVQSEFEIRSGHTTDMDTMVMHRPRPDLLEVSPGLVAPGMTLRLTGRHFGRTEGNELKVYMDGLDCGKVVTLDDSRAEVVVPEGASAGQLFARILDYSGATTSSRIARALVWSDDARGLGPGATLDLPVKRSIRLGVQALDHRARLLPEAPPASWAVTGPALWTDAATRGLQTDRIDLTGHAPGDVRVRSSFGNLALELGIHLYTVRISTLVSSLVLDMPPPSGAADAGFVTEAPLPGTVVRDDGRPGARSRWTVRDPEMVEVSSGRVRALHRPGVSREQATVLTLESLDDPEVRATFEVRVRPRTVIRPEVD
jgi:hypothetical protein